jgi:hypothetical protein
VPLKDDNKTVIQKENVIEYESSPAPVGTSVEERVIEYESPPTPLIDEAPTPAAPAPEPTRAPQDAQTDEQQPDSWALLNIILAGLGIILTVVVFPLIRRRPSHSEERAEYAEGRRSVVWIVVGIVLAIISIVVFFITEDIGQSLVWVDKWTIVNAVLLVVAVICGSVGLPQRKK